MKKVVIIGAGLGGLSAGALLAKNGFRVTLLEQHSIVGGCATTFQRGNFTCEVGLHEMDGVYADKHIRTIFETLGVYENVEFVKPKEFFKIHTKYGEFVMPDGIDRAKDVLKNRFQSEHIAIERYFELIGKISKCYERLSDLKWYEYILFPLLFLPVLKHKSKSVSDVLDKLTQNEELKLILNANVQYYNDSPNTLCFLLHAIAQYSYYKDGGYFIKGGSYKLSEYLAKIITDNGGEVITRAKVVSATKNSLSYMYKKELCEIGADIIISNISPSDTCTLFGFAQKETKQISESITTIYLGFNKELKSHYGEGAYSSFIFEDIDSLSQIPRKLPFVFVDYSQLDSRLCDKSRSFGSVCMVDRLERWEGLSKDEYKKAKDEFLQQILTSLERYYPNLRELVEYAEVATPKTMLRYTKMPQGTAYGYKPTPEQFFRIPKVKSDKIDNLYFVGQFVICGGFRPAILSGAMAYKKVLKDHS